MRLVPEAEEKELTPLMYFLASSFNVELVYIILKCITQFAYVVCEDGNDEVARRKRDRLQLTTNERDGSATLTLRKVKIKNFRDWDRTRAADLVQDNWVRAEQPRAGEILQINQNITVTYHGLRLFQGLFREFNLRSFVLFHPSLSPKFNRDAVFKAGEGAGRSGSFFFFSHDRKFIVKTMTTQELQLFLRLLPDYIEHLKTHKQSLLAKIFGVFTVKADAFNEVHVVLMENTLRLKNPQNLKYIFDLKGSTVDRVVKGYTTPSTTLKDLNFLVAAEKIEDFTAMGPKLPKRLSQALRKDVEFLRSHNLMDYSLLLGIETEYSHESSQPVRRVRKESVRLKSLVHSNKEHKNKHLHDIDIGEVFAENHRFKHGHKVFHVSIIDYLQEWNFSKKSERVAKTLLLNKDGAKLSAIEPNQYAVRFRHFMDANVFI